MKSKPLIGIDVRLVTEDRTGDSMVFRYLTKALIEHHPEYSYRLYTHVIDPLELNHLAEILGCKGRDNVTVVSLKHGGNRFAWNGWILPWELMRRPVDIYHTQYIAPLWLPRKIRLVTHIHDVSFAAHPEWIASKDRFFLSLLIPRSLKRAQKIVAPSVFTQSEIVTFYPYTQNKIEVVPNAVGDEWLSVSQSAINEETVREKYGLPQRYIIATGTMQPRKNIPYLVQLWRERPEELASVGLVLTGNPLGYHVDDSIQSKSVGDIIFTGYVSIDELRVLVGGAELLVFPSLYEGFGIPILEAFAVGTPVLASDIPPFHEVGENAATYFDPKSLAHGQEILYSLLVHEDQKKRLAEAGRFRLSHFHWKKSADILATTYESLLKVF